MSKDTFEHDSIFGWINMLKRRDNRYLLETGERPPYPIIIDQPNLLDVAYNLNLADFGVFLFFTAVGFPVGRYVAKAPWRSESLKRSMFKNVWNFCMAWGLCMGMWNSSYRLKGLVDNGLKWKRRETTLNKYDFTK